MRIEKSEPRVGPWAAIGFGNNWPGHLQEQSRRRGTDSQANQFRFDQPWEGNDLGQSSSQGGYRFMEK